MLILVRGWCPARVRGKCGVRASPQPTQKLLYNWSTGLILNIFIYLRHLLEPFLAMIMSSICPYFQSVAILTQAVLQHFAASNSLLERYGRLGRSGGLVGFEVVRAPLVAVV